MALKALRVRAGMPTGARRAPFPGFVEPCDPSLREQAPQGRDWLHETKLDGYRAQLHLRAGHVASTFYHMGPLPPIPKAVHQLHIEKREGGEGVRVWVDNLDGLLGLVDMGAVELHAWAATVDGIEHPDRLVFDLDPGEGIAWQFVLETALQLRGLLQEEGLNSWPKLTGGKGVHLMVPITPGMTHDAARAYCRRLAQRLEQSRARLYTTSAAPERRKGRLFIDYLRNGRGTTAVGAYSPRALSRFPIAAPVTWAQVMRGIPPDAFTMASPFKPRR